MTKARREYRSAIRRQDGSRRRDAASAPVWVAPLVALAAVVAGGCLWHALNGRLLMAELDQCLAVVRRTHPANPDFFLQDQLAFEYQHLFHHRDDDRVTVLSGRWHGLDLEPDRHALDHDIVTDG